MNFHEPAVFEHDRPVRSAKDEKLRIRHGARPLRPAGLWQPHDAVAEARLLLWPIAPGLDAIRRRAELGHRRLLAHAGFFPGREGEQRGVGDQLVRVVHAADEERARGAQRARAQKDRRQRLGNARACERHGRPRSLRQVTNEAVTQTFLLVEATADYKAPWPACGGPCDDAGRMVRARRRRHAGHGHRKPLHRGEIQVSQLHRGALGGRAAKDPHVTVVHVRRVARAAKDGCCALCWHALPPEERARNLHDSLMQRPEAHSVGQIGGGGQIRAVRNCIPASGAGTLLCSGRRGLLFVLGVGGIRHAFGDTGCAQAITKSCEHGLGERLPVDAVGGRAHCQEWLHVNRHSCPRLVRCGLRLRDDEGLPGEMERSLERPAKVLRVEERRTLDVLLLSFLARRLHFCRKLGLLLLVR
mmetsp:Transcript_7465/g.21840  ORF Transcript_7465/g.21840 Transcript_7465/m.21840 type:complete len:415 (-) Transcript_7465:377-1621(-)